MCVKFKKNPQIRMATIFNLFSREMLESLESLYRDNQLPQLPWHTKIDIRLAGGMGQEDYSTGKLEIFAS